MLYLNADTHLTINFLSNINISYLLHLFWYYVDNLFNWRTVTFRNLMYHYLSSFSIEYHQPWNLKVNVHTYACITVEERSKLSFEVIQRLSSELPYVHVQNSVFTDDFTANYDLSVTQDLMQIDCFLLRDSCRSQLSGNWLLNALRNEKIRLSCFLINGICF